MTLTDASSTALLPSRALGLIAALPPVLIVAGAAALGYSQAPRLEPAISGFFAPPPVVATPALEPPINRAPVAKIAPEPPPAPQAAEVMTPQPLPVVPVVKHAAKKPVAPRVVKVLRVNAAPQPRYVYPVYRAYQPAYAPVPIPIPFVGGRGGRMFGGFGGLFGRH